MKTLLDARTRLVDMHNDSLAQLNLSDVVVDTYHLPDRAWQWALSGLCLLIFSTFPFREQLVLPSLPSLIWSLGGTLPGLARFAYHLAPVVLGIMVVLHGAEAVWFARTRLTRHWVEVGTAVWCAWVLDCLVEGIGCISRFERLVGRMEADKKH